MATVVHCLYCFEVLSASLQERDHLALPQVEDLWARFQTREEDALKETLHDESDNLDHDSEHEEGDDLMSEPDEGQEDLLAGEEEPQAAEPATNKSTLQLPSISRIQASPSSASASSTPSSISASSSRLGLDDSSSKTSSSTSIFSFGRRSQQPSPVVRDDRYPLFVTWNTFSGRGHKSLRGCIGTFEPQELSSGLKNYALTAAFDDTRFAPIDASELPSLATHLTLLHTFTPCAHPLDWSLGKHGIRISFTHQGRRLGATYLPDVAVEQGWTKEETIVSLMRKAGWTGRSREWRTIGDLRAIRYEGEGADCRWNIWREWRDWVDRIGEASKDKDGP
ncbi:MAG: hypothetical protein LQ350_001267 [Teloschistes chrysophthalmus]|nr:MAG: hypothetical protein LQ350_001267 [Niorma chrysophthalma]